MLNASTSGICLPVAITFELGVISLSLSPSRLRSSPLSRSLSPSLCLLPLSFFPSLYLTPSLPLSLFPSLSLPLSSPSLSSLLSPSLRLPPSLLTPSLLLYLYPPLYLDFCFSPFFYFSHPLFIFLCPFIFISLSIYISLAPSSLILAVQNK